MLVVAVLIPLAIAIGIAWHAGLFRLHDRRALVAAIDRAETIPYFDALFVLIFAVAAAIGVPATPLTLAGGALFGIGRGIVLNWLGEMLAALLAYWIVRATGLRSAKAVAASADRLTTPRARATLFRLRLIPVAPFALLNAGAAIAGMPFRDYALVTAAGILPVTVIYTVSASQLVAGVHGSSRRALLIALAGGAVLVGMTFLPALLRRGRPKNGA